MKNPLVLYHQRLIKILVYLQRYMWYFKETLHFTFTMITEIVFKRQWIFKSEHSFCPDPPTQIQTMFRFLNPYEIMDASLPYPTLLLYPALATNSVQSQMLWSSLYYGKVGHNKDKLCIYSRNLKVVLQGRFCGKWRVRYITGHSIINTQTSRSLCGSTIKALV